MAKRLKIVRSPLPSDEFPDIAWYYSTKAWYTNENHRAKWLAAVQYLRTTKKGWHIDKAPENLPKLQQTL